jgi:hypothetical protein
MELKLTSLQHNLAPTAAYTIDEWCHWRRLSKALYFKLQRQGKGPRVTRINRKVTISREADAAWAAAREAE